MRRKHKKLLVLGIFVAISASFGMLFPASKTEAAINPQINFQGKLTNPDGTNVTDGTYSVRFRIYTDPTADAASVCTPGTTTCKWEETQGSVSVSSGIFQVALGSSTALPGSVNFNTAGLYLGVKVGADAEMTPRITFTAAPYAFNADQIDGLDATNIVQLAQGIQTDSSNSNASISINKTGSAGLVDLKSNSNSVFSVANDGSTLIKSQTNSATAFQIQNTSGVPVFIADTTDGPNLLTNSGFETGTNGWSVAGTGASIAQNTTKANTYFGVTSLRVNGATSGSTVLTVNSFISAVPAGTYTFSFYANSSTTLAGLAISLGSGTCTPNVTSIGAGSFQRYQCTVTTTATTTAVTITTTTTGATYYLDAVQLQTGSVAAPYYTGALQLRGVITNPVSIQPISDSSTAFQVANTGGTRLLTVDSEAVGDPLEVQIGSNSFPDSTQVLLGLDSFNAFADTATCGTAVNQGTMYYNTVTGAIRVCVNGSWEDMASTGGLGLLAFGVIPDSSNAGTPGDIAGVSNYSNSPCKVVWTATQQVTVEPCIAYSGGRKIIIPLTNLLTNGLAANTFSNVCLTGTNGQPALGTGSTTETSAALPAFSANNPVACLATVKTSATAGNVGFIWDTRTFTNTQKQFATINAVNSNGFLALGTTTLGVSTIAATAAQPLRGVVVATAGTASTTTPNAIIATTGPAFVKFASGATATINAAVQSFTTTAGYGTSVASNGAVSSYAYGGLLMTSISTSCTTTNTVLSACQYSPLVDFKASR